MTEKPDAGIVPKPREGIGKKSHAQRCWREKQVNNSGTKSRAGRTNKTTETAPSRTPVLRQIVPALVWIMEVENRAASDRTAVNSDALRRVTEIMDKVITASQKMAS